MVAFSQKVQHFAYLLVLNIFYETVKQSLNFVAFNDKNCLSY